MRLLLSYFVPEIQQHPCLASQKINFTVPIGAAIEYKLLMLACTLPSIPIQLDLFRVASPIHDATASRAADHGRGPTHDAEHG